MKKKTQETGEMKNKTPENRRNEEQDPRKHEE